MREKNLKLVAVAGTHGKTTTTSMIVWAMKQLKIPVSYLIGSQISFGQSSQHQKGSEYFILEADEFDRNFLKYDPAISLITNVDYDHPDVYFDQGEYNQAFADFLAKTKQLTCIYKPDYTKIDSLNKFQNIDVIDQKSEEYTRISKKIKLIGKHNRDNAFLAVKAMKKICRISEEEIIKSMSTFPGSKRRMEKIMNGLYSDYAHHPTEIAASLQMASEINGDAIVVYQPHQNVRQHKVKELYKDCFDRASKVYWLPTHLSRESKELRVIEPKELVENVEDNIKVEIAELGESLKKNIVKHLEENKTVICMGAGSIDGWLRENFIGHIGYFVIEYIIFGGLEMTKYLFEGDMIMSEYQTKFPTTMSDFSENSLESSYKQKVLTNKINSDKEYIIDLINKYNIPSNDKLFGLLGNIDEFLNYDVITNSFGIDNFRLKSLLALIGELGLHIVDKNILIIILIRQINLLNLRSHNLNMFNFENDIDFVNDIYRSASFLLIDNYWLFLLYTSSLMNKDITCKKFGLSSDDFGK
ncbi:hypothetical protein HC766_03140 [Candidatus Gracilibacteria bacterium]|nr:hypothetical protein [Candidatus Gracilibacteria bacterium]